MIQVEKLKLEHLNQIFEQKATAYLRPYFTEAHYKGIEESPHSFTAIVDGRVILCGGVIEYWDNRGEAWAVLDQDCKKEFIQIHNAVRRFLDICPVRRIEAAIDIGFPPGHRWVRALGFKMEAPKLTHYRPDGGDCSLYARVK